jgi:hypothetical protein
VVGGIEVLFNGLHKGPPASFDDEDEE